MGGVSVSSNGFLVRKEKLIVAAFSIFAFALRIPLSFRPRRELTQLPYGDDAYYLFSIARHLAVWNGPTVDGAHLTNGFQPLIVFFYTLVFWLCGSDAWVAVRASFILSGFIAALSVLAVWFAVGALLRSGENGENPAAPVIGAALWTFSISILAQTTNGLETGLYSLLLLISVAIYAQLRVSERESRNTTLQTSLLGIALGLTILARIDAAILVAIIFVIMVAARQVRSAIIIAAIAFVISAPWWIYNLLYFGSIMPTSGQAENIWPLPAWENIHRALQAVTDIIPILIYAPDNLSFTMRLILGAGLIGAVWLIAWKIKLIEYMRSKTHFAVLLPFIIFSFGLLIYYTFLFRAPHFIPRYMQPMRIVWVVSAALAAPEFFRLLNRSRRSKLYRGMVSIALALALAFGINRYSTNFFNIRDSPDFYNFGLFAEAHPDEKIGMLQSGIASSIAPNVINLDGKVNAAALHAHQQGRLAQYLRNEKFTYIADQKPFIEDIAAIARKDNLYFDSVGMIGKIQLMKRRDH